MPLVNMNSEALSLTAALSGDRMVVAGRSGELSYYRSIPEICSNPRPLVLVHSVNAAAAAHEMRPLYEHYRQQRPVYALDLPGFGFSERSARPYTPRLMTDALHDLLGAIRGDQFAMPVDGLAVSLSCEFLSRAAVESPGEFHSLALVSPTGFNRSQPKIGAPGSNRGMPAMLGFLELPGIGTSLFRGLASRASVRFFLQKTWGSKHINEAMADYSYLTARQPGAHRAPFYFLSGFLFSGDINRLYSTLSQPVWMSHGVRGDFTDYRLKTHYQSKANWRVREFNTGALPYFEIPDEFIKAYDEFLNNIAEV